MNFTPDVIAVADQFTADLNHRIDNAIKGIRELLTTGADPVMLITQTAVELANISQEHPDIRDGVAGMYVALLYRCAAQPEKEIL